MFPHVSNEILVINHFPAGLGRFSNYLVFVYVQRQSQLGTKDGGDLAEQVERYVVMLVVLDVANRGRGYRYRQLGGDVLSSQTPQFPKAFEVVSGPVSYAYPVNVIDSQRITVTPFTDYGKDKRGLLH